MILLDTHVWVWWADDPDRLSTTAAEAIDGAAEIGVSTISVWEVAMLAERGLLRFEIPVRRWVTAALALDERVVNIAPTADIAMRAGSYDSERVHGDPADRIIMATAASIKAQLVTRDRALREYAPQSTIW